MEKLFLLVGDGFSGLTESLREQGHEYIILKDRLRTKYPDKKLKRRVVCDFSDRKNILKAVDTLPHIDAVMSIYEHYVLPAAWIAEHLGLPGLPVPAAEACTDKFRMRRLFAKAPQQISPAFTLVKNEQEVRKFAQNHHFPIMLKPANLAKSLLITKNETLEELLVNYQRTIEQIASVYERYAPHAEPKLLVEEFLEGTIHSVDAFVDAKGEPQILEHIVDYQTGYDIGFADNFHYSRILPSKLNQVDQDSLRICAALGVEALGMKSSPAHIEIIMTKNGPRIVEIGARNGGYRERMHRLANGIDITRAAATLALGGQPDITATKNESCAVLELFPQDPGFFTGIDNLDALQALPSFYDVRVKAKQGAFVGKASDGYKMCAAVILHNQDAEQFEADLTYVNKYVRVTTTPPVS